MTIRNMFYSIWAKRSIKEIKPVDRPHPDGFVYRVTLEYRLDPAQSPFIRITDDGNVTGAKICSATYNNHFGIQFGGEPDTPAVLASILFYSYSGKENGK